MHLCHWLHRCYVIIVLDVCGVPDKFFALFDWARPIQPTQMA